MKPKKGLPTTAYVLLGILALAALSLTLTRRDMSAFPSATSYGPSGTRALAELLQQKGYKVDVTRLIKPKLQSSDVVIAFEFPSSLRIEQFPDQGDSKQASEKHATANDTIESFLKGGGNALILTIPDNFQTASKLASDSPFKIKSTDGRQTRSISYSPAQPDLPAFLTEASATPVPVWVNETGRVVDSYQIGKGRCLFYTDAVGATNRFLDRVDNASVMLGLIKSVAPDGGHIIFMDSAFGNATELSLLQTIGPWAIAAWWQLVFLFIVVIYTLGKRFGLADEERAVQSGQRDLVDAVSFIYRRSKSSNVALGSVLNYTDKQIRKALKMPVDALTHRRDERLPESLVMTLRRAEVASGEKIPASVAVDLASRVERETQEFLGTPTKPARPGRKRR